MDRAVIARTVLETLRNFDLEEQPGGPREITEATVLFGPDGLLDSIGLVSFLLDVEENLRAQSGVHVTLADERAMSQTHSPFRRVSSLVDYAVQVTTKQGLP